MNLSHIIGLLGAAVEELTVFTDEDVRLEDLVNVLNDAIDMLLCIQEEVDDGET